MSCRLFEKTAQKIAASQTAVQRKETGRLTRHLKLSLLGSLTAAGKEKRAQAVSHIPLHAESTALCHVAVRMLVCSHNHCRVQRNLTDHMY